MLTSYMTDYKKQGYILGAEVGPGDCRDDPNQGNGVEPCGKAYWTSGIYVNLMIPPATPNGECLLRCSISAAHTSKTN